MQNLLFLLYRAIICCHRSYYVIYIHHFMSFNLEILSFWKDESVNLVFELKAETERSRFYMLGDKIM